jgi:hypothetical protein
MSDELDTLLGIKPDGTRKKPPEEKTPALVLAVENDADEEKDERNPVYGTDRTKKRSFMLTFRLADGNTHLIPYNHIAHVSAAHGRLIAIHASSGTVKIEGERLDFIVERLARGDLAYVNESKETAPNGVRVTKIRFETGAS